MEDMHEVRGEEQGEQRISPFIAFSGEQLFPASSESGKQWTPKEFQETYPERFRIWEGMKRPLGEVSADDVKNTRASRGWLQMANNLDRYATAHHSGEKQTLRARQMDVFDDIHSAVERGEKEGYIEAPTGFGKTVMFGEVVAATDVPTIIVVPRKRLVEQTYESIKKFNPDISVGRVYGDKKEYGEQVIITTYQSLTSDTEGERFPTEDVALVILDEVDEATGTERMKAIDRFPDAMLLGFSATPVKVEGEEHADKRVAKMMENEIHNISLREGVEEGYLSSFSSYVVQVDTDLSNVHITNTGNFNEDELEQAINTKAQNEAAVRFFLEVREKDRREQQARGKAPEPLTTSVYASSVKHAQGLATEFQEAGVTAAAVWGGQDATEQEEIMQKWADGEIEVVCSKDLLVRGNDIPKIRLIENIAPTASYAVEKQRCGRGLRLDPNNPDKHTIVADFVYPNANRKGQQVTFAEIADGAEIYRNPEQNVQQKAEADTTTTDQAHSDFQIEGLTVTTNPNEVMRIIKEIASQREDLSELSDNDFAITRSAFSEHFVGGYEKLSPIAEDVIQELQEEHPKLVVQRKNGPQTVTVVTDSEQFMQKMQERGVQLKDQTTQELQDTDFALTTTVLRTHFVGKYERLAPIADEVLRELQEEHPELVVQRKSGTRTVTAVTDNELFMQKMQGKGIQLKEQTSQIVDELQEGEFALTTAVLRTHFVGGDKRLTPIVEEVRQELQKEHPELVVQRKSGKNTVTAVTNPDVFIRKMLARGVRLREE